MSVLCPKCGKIMKSWMGSHWCDCHREVCEFMELKDVSCPGGCGCKIKMWVRKKE